MVSRIHGTFRYFAGHIGYYKRLFRNGCSNLCRHSRKQMRRRNCFYCTTNPRAGAFQRGIVNRENLCTATPVVVFRNFFRCFFLVFPGNVIMYKSTRRSGIQQQHVRCFFTYAIMYRKTHGSCKKQNSNQSTT